MTVFLLEPWLAHLYDSKSCGSIVDYSATSYSTYLTRARGTKRAVLTRQQLFTWQLTSSIICIKLAEYQHFTSTSVTLTCCYRRLSLSFDLSHFFISWIATQWRTILYELALFHIQRVSKCLCDILGYDSTHKNKTIFRIHVSGNALFLS